MLEIDMVYDERTRCNFYVQMEPIITAVLKDGGDLEESKYNGIIYHGLEAWLGEVHLINEIEKSTGISRISVREEGDLVLRVIVSGKDALQVPTVRSGYWIARIKEYASRLKNENNEDKWKDVSDTDIGNSFP